MRPWARVNSAAVGLGLSLASCASPHTTTAHGWRSGDPDLAGLQQTSGNTRVNCTPADATVRIDGVRFGSAQDFDGRERLLPLAPGLHQVELSRQGFQTFSIELRGGAWRQTLGVTLDPLH